MQLFNFRDHFSAPFRGLYLPMSDHRFSRLAKGTPSEYRLSIGITGLGVKLFCFCLFFWIWLRPRYKIPDFLYNSTRPHLHCDGLRRNRGDPSSLYRTYGALQLTSITKKHSCSGLTWRRPRADRGLSRPTSVLRTTIGVCKILSRSVEIWQYEGQKPVFE